MATNRRERPATLSSIAGQLESLRRHIASLDADMQKLADRIIRFDDEDTRIYRQPWLPAESAAAATPQSISQMIREVDARVENIERDFRAVRAKIEDLERGGLLSDDIKPFLKPGTDRGRR